MAYDISKKMNVGHGKIMATLINTLFLRKTDAEKQYLALTGGTLTGDTTLDNSSLSIKKDSDTAKVNIDQNGDLELYSDGDVKFRTSNNQYFTASPSYISLNNKHNHISVELVNGEGVDSPYGGFDVYDNSTGIPEVISAINSGYVTGIPYQEYTVREEGNFVWTFVGDEELYETVKLDLNGLTLINKDEDQNELTSFKFQSASGNMATISSIAGDMRIEASEIMLNNVASIGSDSLDLIGGSSIEFDSANDGVKMYSTENSNVLTFDFKGKKITLDENGLNGNSATATKAEKLSTERTVSGGSDIILNYKYDGSGDSVADVGFYACNAKVGNKNNYPYHRFAKIDLTSASYEDWATTLYISQGYNNGGFGICRISLRTNGIGLNSSAEVKWLCRNGLSADFVQIAIDAAIGATHADAFIKTASAYASTTIRAFASESRGDIERTWTLIDSEEVNNTDEATKHNSVECYKSIESAANEIHGEPYTGIVTGVDTVVEQAKRDSEGRNISHTYITNIEQQSYGVLRMTYGDGFTATVNLLAQ